MQANGSEENTGTSAGTDTVVIPKRNKRDEVSSLLFDVDVESPAQAAAELPRDSSSTLIPPITPLGSEPRPLWGEQPQPQVILKKERLRHRLISTLLAEGYDHKEIAEMLGVTPATVNYVAKQPFAIEQALQTIHTSADKVMKKLHEAADKAADKLIEMLDTAEVPYEVLRKTSNDILDRKYGKPNQPYTTQVKPAEQMSDEEIAKHLQN